MIPHLDFWNNPIVVSAFRVKYRRGGLFLITISYLVLLAALGMVMMFYSIKEQEEGHPWPTPWHQIYLLILLGLQLVVSGIIAASSTAASMRAEVVNRTLDFQRTSALHPRQILIGKLFGEPALAYLMAIAIFPLAFLCLVMRIPGLDPFTFLLLFVNVFTSTIMMGSFGLLNKLVIPTGKITGGGGNPGIGIIVLLGMFASQLGAFAGSSFLVKPWSAAPIGLLSPIPTLVGVGQHEPWQYGLWFFGLRIPFIIVTPISQLLISWVCLHIMERRLINTVTPALGKRTAYVILVIIDLLTAGVLFPNTSFPLTLNTRIAAFCVVHFLASFWVVFNVTPGREVLESWAWRWRGMRSRLLDLFLHDRAENCLVLLTACLIGLFFGVSFVAALDWSDGTPDEQVTAMKAMGISCLMLLSLGTLYQWLMLISQRQATGVFVLFLIVANALPALLGGMLMSYQEEQGQFRSKAPLAAGATERPVRQSNFILDLVPGYHVVSWTSSNLPTPSPIPLVIAYTALLALTWRSLRKRLAGIESAIDRKLEAMGVRPAPMPQPAAAPAAS